MQVVSGIQQISASLDGMLFHAYWLEGAKPILVDTGTAAVAADVILPHIQRTYESGPAWIVNTHAHADHYGGNGVITAAFPACCTAAHAADAAWIEDRELHIQEMYGRFESSVGFFYSESLKNEIRTAISSCVRVQRKVKAGDTVSSGDETYQVIHTPGHSPGHIALYRKRDRVLLLGDAIVGSGQYANGRLNAPPTYDSLPHYQGVIAAIERLAPHYLLPTHFPVMEGADVQRFVKETKEFVSTLHAFLLHQISRSTQGHAVLELAELANDHLAPAELGYQWIVPVMAHLRTLEAEGYITFVKSDDGVLYIYRA
ncbi:MBL fold metallo-hydrolase [Aneurinibacillus sp. REN35]|uniref:MBL fold metallo-hydrolase n=1 Tax=Aneurinibacillus sp. REN35 TaxID=3237286 RepID=UPI003529C41C